MEESSNWVVQNLQNALATWNDKLSEIWLLITQSPEEFKDGTIDLEYEGEVQNKLLKVIFN